ncbi:hypothetical protein C6H65_00370 [Photorhabdus luminescens]|nr:hypothetical protein C6H65_00370 [Photorhabdus luminescens]
MIRKLPNARRNNLTLSALCEYNRPVKCIYALEYVDNQTLRQFVQQALNRLYPSDSQLSTATRHLESFTVPYKYGTYSHDDFITYFLPATSNC